MTRLNILFAGASRLVGLMERFRAAAAAEEVTLEALSIEDASPWHAIEAAGVCEVARGPAFDDPAFPPFLLDLAARHRAAALIPVVDRALMAALPHRAALESAGTRLVASDTGLCALMDDKREADRLFRSHGLPVPDGDGFPRVAKPRRGSSGRGFAVFQDAAEQEFWSARNRSREHLIQPLLRGDEYSVDAYVAAGGRTLGAVARRRIVVVGGEVMVTTTERNDRILALAARVLAIPGWSGPINIQAIDAPGGAVLVEVNPRFSGGITCSIEAGLDAPRWILRECLGRPLPDRPIDWRAGLCMTRSRRDHFTWLS
jgi:carbamoyl-phosphate synthase large subunit